MFNFQKFSNLDDQYNYSLFILFTQKLKTNLMTQNVFNIFENFDNDINRYRKNIHHILLYIIVTQLLLKKRINQL